MALKIPNSLFINKKADGANIDNKYEFQFSSDVVYSIEKLCRFHEIDFNQDFHVTLSPGQNITRGKKSDWVTLSMRCDNPKNTLLDLDVSGYKVLSKKTDKEKPNTKDSTDNLMTEEQIQKTDNSTGEGLLQETEREVMENDKLEAKHKAEKKNLEAKQLEKSKANGNLNYDTEENKQEPTPEKIDEWCVCPDIHTEVIIKATRQAVRNYLEVSSLLNYVPLCIDRITKNGSRIETFKQVQTNDSFEELH